MRLLATAISVAAVSAANVNIYHRVFHPSLPTLPYAHRASIEIAPDNTHLVTPSTQLSTHISDFADALGTLDNTEGAFYQVALEHEGDSSDVHWDFSSVKICHLPTVSAETMLLHLGNAQDAKPFALDYFISPIPRDGSCPDTPNSMQIQAPAALRGFANKIQQLNSTVLLRRPNIPASPELRPPPAITPEGEVVKPVPEKSFLQKYWMYLGAVALVLLLGGGGSEEEPKRGGGGQ
ncbi:hypothetical protein B0H34DRAFT_229325 [Crassisporium funariophilum]|nr:hypothetical protein B0H34DRAFT_229325 [Crassisporium funariophilum]